MRLLETHGCQGGAHAGYVRAGWDVTGVDIDRRHARYYPGELIIADAATYIREHGHEYDAIHTSPPCQWYTRGNAKGRATGNSKWQRSIPPIREALEATGRPYVIENVTDAGWDMVDPIALCGCMFNLSTIDTDGIRIHLKRERLFETNWPLTEPRACDHSGIEWFAGAYGGARRDKYEAKYVRNGAYNLGRTLRILNAAWGQAGMESYVIDGIGQLCGRYNGDLADELLVLKLRNMRGGVKGLMGKAAVIREQMHQPIGACVAAAAVEVLNAGKGGKKLPNWWRTEAA